MVILEEPGIHSPITVLVRMRPSESTIEHTPTSVSLNNTKNQLVTFGFDHCFGPTATTEELYGIIKPYIMNDQGKNLSKSISILAYGHTCSGKTHTMCGGVLTPGIVHLVLKDLLSIYTVTTAFIEIYNERVIDLLDQAEKRLTESYEGFVIQGLTEKEVKDQDEFAVLLKKAAENRKTERTCLNKASSRSHLIVKVRFGDRTISFVDLAGSENNRKTGNSGKRLEESSSINRSLFALNNVINAIVHKEKRIPYRDSRLTRILKDSIGGTGRCFLIATIVGGSEHSLEVMSTLSFAAKSRNVVNKVALVDIEKKGKYTGNVKLRKRINNLVVQRVVSKTRTNANEPSSFTRSSVEMTPITKQKSYACFLSKAKEYEERQDYRAALEIYRTVMKFASSEYIEAQIQALQARLKKVKTRFTENKMLEILNSGSFLEIKKLSGIGDKRAQSIVDYIAGGSRFQCLSELKKLFSEKVVLSIRKHAEAES